MTAGQLSALLLVLSFPFVSVAHMVVIVGALALRLQLAGASAGGRVLIVAINLLAVPFVWAAIFPERLEVVVLVLAAFPWLLHLPEEHRDQELLAIRWRGRSPTRRLFAIVAAFAGATATGVITGQIVLALAAAATLVLVAFAVGVSLVRFWPHLLSVDTVPVRALARQPCQFQTILNVDPRAAGHIRLAAGVSWAEVEPKEVRGKGTPLDVPLDVRLVPPLAGSGTVHVDLIWTDPWGLTGSVMDRPLANLRVIPRATYAAWLARRYLETSRVGGPSAMILPEARSATTARRGLDIYGAREYEPGDTLRDVLWKQTAKFDTLIVKDRRDDPIQAGILAIRLAGRDPDETDRLAYHLLMTTLTLAQEGIPVSFATYAPDGPRSAIPMLAPRAAVLRALGLSGQISVVPSPKRLLSPAHPLRLRRTLGRLQQAGDGAAKRLAEVVAFEFRAHQARARRHPAAQALATVLARTQAPAVIVVISGVADDAEALNFALEGWGVRGFQRMDVLAVSS